MFIYLEDYLAAGPNARERKKHEVKDCSTLGELIEELDYKKYEHFIVVNGLIKPHHYQLNEGDLVTILPVVSGG
ncbi:MAG: MoaD/ThiS family protein [Bacillota bacterium]|nr:MoaD/ThiS family protein [Bacillota bacterium]